MQRLLKSAPHLSAPLRLLAELGFPHAVIMCGAARDTLCADFYGRDIPIRDIDIRVDCSEETFNSKLPAFLKHFGMERNDSGRYNIGELDINFNITPADPIAALPIAENCIKKSNIGLSAVAFCIDSAGEETFVYTSHFLNDRANKVVTLLNDSNIPYAEKVAKKYGFNVLFF